MSPSVDEAPEESPGEFDNLIMERVCASDEAALNELVDRYWVPLVQYAMGFVGGLDAAEDTVQEAFIRLWETRQRWLPGGSPRRYLYTVVRNRCLNERDHRRVRAAWREKPGKRQRYNPTPLEDLQHQEVLEALHSAIDRLPERRREVFTLVYLHGLTYRQVAGVMGIATPTVANQVSAALDAIRKVLAPVTDEQI
jgi:RNA polymerase sigma-70 factor (family 1)